VVIQSAFEVPAEQRATIQNALNETFAANVPIAFKTAPDLISGIELTANGQKVVWSIDGYLTAMERGVNDALETKKA
jgi:F-type H+-transporting ATPase subunit b